MTTLHDHILSCLQCLGDLASDLVEGEDGRVKVFRQELAKARALLESQPEQVNGRPTLAQAHGMAEQVGVTVEEAEMWWLARESVDWMKGTAGGGSLPIGSNHAADLKTFTNAVRGRNQTNGSNGHAKPAESTWHYKTQLENVEAELGRLEEKALYDPLSLADRDLRQRMRERRKELRQKLTGME